MKDVVYKVHMNKRDSLKQFHKEVVKECVDGDNVHIEVGRYRQANTNSDVKYVVGHVK